MLEELDELFGDKIEVPTQTEWMYFRLLELGLDLEKIEKLPVPYLVGIMKVKAYIQQEQKK